MTVYIVTFEEWDDFEIRGVFATLEKAEQYFIDCGQSPAEEYGPLYIKAYEVK